MLTIGDIETLNAARKLLDGLMKESWSLRWESTGSVDAFDYGKLHETAEAARDAIFNMLNTARAYCDVEITDDQMHMREEAEVDA